MMDSANPQGSKSREKTGGGFFDRPSPQLSWIIFSALSILCALLIYGATSHGKGLTIYTDSISYLRLSRRLFAHYDTAIGTTLWPPLFPLFLSVTRLLDVDPLSGAYPLQFFLFVVLGGLLPFLFYRSGAIRCLPLAFSGVIICLCLHLKNANDLLSDLLFCNLVLVFFLLIGRFVRKPSLPLLLALSAIANLACATRYVGIALIAWGGLVVLAAMLYLKNKFGSSLLWAGSYVLLSSLFVIVWGLRNHHLDGTFFGPRESSDYTIGPLARDTLLAFVDPFSLGLLGPGRMFLANLILLSLIYAMARYARRARGDAGQQNNADRSAVMTGLLAISWIATYTGLLCYSAYTVRFDEISPRFLLPIYAFEIFLVLLAADRFLAKGFRLTTALFLIYLGANALVPVENNFLAAPRSYGSNPFFDAVKSFPFPAEAQLFSNDFNKLYFYTGLENRGSLIIPENTHFNPKFSPTDFPDAKNVYLIWMDAGKAYYISPSDPRLASRLVPLKKIAGGAIYKILPRQRGS